jgi:hypothetical protein
MVVKSKRVLTTDADGGEPQDAIFDYRLAIAGDYRGGDNSRIPSLTITRDKLP